MQRLTKREMEVLMLMGEGKSAQEAADQLFCSRRTIEFHLANVYHKLEVSNRVQATRRAVSLGLLEVEDRRRLTAV